MQRVASIVVTVEIRKVSFGSTRNAVSSRRRRRAAAPVAFAPTGGALKKSFVPAMKSATSGRCADIDASVISASCSIVQPLWPSCEPQSNSEPTYANGTFFCDKVLPR